MLKRTSKKNIDNIINKNPNWKILDIGCGFSAHPKASVIADEKDLQDFYRGKKFIKITQKKLPFNDKEFDFVISSHVIEHVEDFQFFLKELQRITSKGYIELPTKLGDNLVFENVKDHIWWFTFDDDKKILVAEKKRQLIDPFLTVSTSRDFFEKLFRDSIVIELAWEDKIEYSFNESINDEKFKKLSFFKIIRKYFSKKIRSIFK